MKDKGILKKTKGFVSIIKEKLWLEQKALEGWMLSDIKLGIRYTFIKSEPKKLIYEIDRFNLPRNPTLKEIRHKKEFLGMAKEMGWSVILHDEDLNYYLSKEYREEEINELYNDYESRHSRAQKYLNRYKEVVTIMIKLALFMSLLGIVITVINPIPSMIDLGFIKFVLAYDVFCLGYCLICEYLAVKYYKELLLTVDELHKMNSSKEKFKNTYRLCLTIKGLKKFLEKQSSTGYHLVKASIIKYVFSTGDPKEYYYTLDSQYLTNKRMKARGDRTFESMKDWNGLNNDWQVQSLHDAEEKKWMFICALQNRFIIYRSQEKDQPEPLNNEKFEKVHYCATLIGKIGAVVLIGGILGILAGFAFG